MPNFLILYYGALGILFTVLFADYSRWQFIDEDDGPGFNLSDEKWHTRRWQMAVVVWLTALPAMPWPWFLFLGTTSAFLWPLSLNILRKKPLFHVGTSKWDKRLGKRQYWLFLGFWLASIVILILTKIFKLCHSC